jgi:hypothetical protein
MWQYWKKLIQGGWYEGFVVFDGVDIDGVFVGSEDWDSDQTDPAVPV